MDGTAAVHSVRVAPSQVEPTCGGCFRQAFHVAFAATKDEDVSIVQESKSFSSGVSLYAVADGHNGNSAARHVRAHFPAELERQLGAWSSDVAVRRALARTFQATDEAVCSSFVQSGCTLTAAVLSSDVLTVANVGDSSAILDTGEEVVMLTADHRIGQNPTEFARLEEAGCRLARLNDYGSGPSSSAVEGIGPVRLWPGGIMVGRGIGDKDVGEILLSKPNIRQVRLPATGARLIIASDGLWDSMPAGRVARILRSHGSACAAATQAVTSVAACRGGCFADDVTVIVVDILPRGCSDFRQICSISGSRLRTALSSPSLTSLAEAAVAATPPKQQPEPARRGLFSCFSKPVVVDEEPPQRSHSVRSAPQLESASFRASERSSSSRSLRGGSERSLRGGVAREPSIRGCKRAITLEIIYDSDTAHWTSADFGRAPSLAAEAWSQRSSGSSMCQVSPRAVVEGLPYGLSLSSLTSDDDSPHSADQLQRSLGRNTRQSLSLKASPLMPGEKKCHGGNAAAVLLALARA